jgi:hypothetical protein
MQRTTEEMEQELLALRAENEQLRRKAQRGDELLAALGGVEPGHFHSPYPSLEAVRKREVELWGPPPPAAPPAIDLRSSEQLALLEQFAGYYDEIPFPHTPAPDWRYFFDNETFQWGDGIVVYSIMRHFRPKRIIEVGAGYSSAAMLDVNERFFDNAIEFTFIEPDPARLYSIARPGDLERSTLMRTEVQEVPVSAFEALGENDILFVDSSHVAKACSDVNFLFFEVFPRLAPGVLIHLHDIFYPFEYQPAWVTDNHWAWNETYLLHAFLLFNERFEIVFFNNFMIRFHSKRVVRTIPDMRRNPGGSIWLRVRP